MEADDFGVVLSSIQGRALLLKHGFTVGLDDTHGTNKHAANLFLVTVPLPDGTTHFGAFIITSSPSATAIARGLSCLKAQIPGWTPLAWIVDCALAERLAIHMVFSTSVVILLCVFHVIQAWRRALATHIGKKHPAYEPLVNALMKLAYRPTPILDDSFEVTSLCAILENATGCHDHVTWLHKYLHTWFR